MSDISVKSFFCFSSEKKREGGTKRRSENNRDDDGNGVITRSQSQQLLVYVLKHLSYLLYVLVRIGKDHNHGHLNGLII